ncbi:MAG: hypothetical protein HQK83_12800 [Fibrobacteria bacterium]|nr:hypothetical protein [Fibrobacteria bacterium]
MASQAEDEFFVPKSTIGGYGELHYNYKLKEGADEAARQLDFHRFIIFYSHAWTEKWSFKSEVELEHNFVKDGQGELELEQAYINYRSCEAFNIQAGVILPSVGLINERHEPPLFLSVERPDYSKYIIPTTWFGNGLSATGLYKGFEYKAAIMEGLDGSKIKNSSGIRSGRQKGFEANAEALMYNGYVGYTGVTGLRTGLSYVYNNAYVDDSTESIPVNLLAVHAKYQGNNIHAVFELGDVFYGSGELESSFGYYFDLGYNVGYLFGLNAEIIPWLRWSDYNTASTTISGGDSEKANHHSKWMIGLALKPISQVVFKVDYGIDEVELDSKKTYLFNIGAGYMF